VHSGNLWGGVETALVALARLRHLSPALDTQFAICWAGRLSEELQQAGVPVHRLPSPRSSRPWTVVAGRRALARTLQRERSEVMVCHSAWSQALLGPAARRVGRRLILWLHSPARGDHWLDRWAKRTSPDLVLYNSRFTAEGSATMYPAVRAEVFYYPAARLQPAPQTAEREALRSELGVLDGTTVIIQVSRMEEWKGQAVLLTALGQLRGLPNWTCWLVGGAQRPSEARYERRLRETAERLDIASRVRFLGQRSDIERLLGAADIFCQPNIGPEPFGLSFIEALWAGLPVVTTRLGGVLEIVDEACGLLIPPGDPATLAAALRDLICNRERRSTLGAMGPSRARALCDPERQMQRLQELMLSLGGSGEEGEQR
jgi:glycosyltransferase involved in cell wall biosynthesis